MPADQDQTPQRVADGPAPVLQLRVDVRSAPDADDTELDAAARELRRELLELDVHEIRQLTAGPAPPGARAIEIAIAGGLVVTAAHEVIRAVVQTAAGWVGRRPPRSVKLTIGDDSLELSEVSDDEQRELVELFLARHAASQA